MARQHARGERGYAMAALLVGMSVMAIMMSVALPVWNTAAQRERETELVFRGEQYARAVELYQRKYAGAFPPNLDVLLSERMLRKRYTDPITDDAFQLLFAGQGTGQPGQIGAPGQTLGQPPAGAGGVGRAGQPAARGAGPGLQAGIMGVTSKSTAASLRQYNGRGRYNEWVFVATQATVEAGVPAGQGGRGRGPGQRGAQPPGGGPGRRGAQPPGIGPGLEGLPGRDGLPQRGRGFPPNFPGRRGL